MRAFFSIAAFGLLGLAATAGAGCGDSGGAGPESDTSKSAFPIPWEELSNPVLADPEIPLKDPCVVYHRGVFHMFTSGASYRTRDFQTYEGPFTGYGSPDVTRTADGRFLLVYQTRDTANPGPDPRVDPDSPQNEFRRLSYRVSEDLETWSEERELYPSLQPDRHIDGSLAYDEGCHCYYLGFKSGVTIQQFRVARSAGPEIDGDWIGPLKAYAGEGCLLDKLVPLIGDTITRWAENYQFLRIDGRWRMIATARDPRRPIDFGYMGSHEPFVYELRGQGGTLEEWTDWVGKRQLQVPQQDWNSLMHANSAYLCDWRDQDGHFYLFYAGTNQPTDDGRGHGRIGVVRSHDLVDWKLPGETD